ncbi:hypothetical protein [Prauserella flavalba]|uniref:hypothetical protein n=1 Tax=Prauserella flavalba TaxID=1477506 RepID=UPI001AEF8DA1|nr:hypothetical protein [Prauserella flavalba]
MNPLRVLREGAAARLARLVDFRIDDRMRGHVERIERHAGRLAEQERRVADLAAELDRVRGDLRWTAGEVERLIPHVAAQEARLEDLRAKIALTPPADKPELAEARSLVEEVQRQHAQVRVRLTGIARYEDRLRKLEDRAGASGD